jgi:hypothetical protein
VIDTQPLGPLARAYLAGVKAGQISADEMEETVFDGTTYILFYGVWGTSAGVLRAMAAIFEAAAELKEGENESQTSARH